MDGWMDTQLFWTVWKKFISSYGSFGERSIWYINLIRKWNWVQLHGFLKAWFSGWLPELYLTLGTGITSCRCLSVNSFNGKGTAYIPMNEYWLQCCYSFVDCYYYLWHVLLFRNLYHKRSQNRRVTSYPLCSFFPHLHSLGFLLFFLISSGASSYLLSHLSPLFPSVSIFWSCWKSDSWFGNNYEAPAVWWLQY